MNLFVKGGIAYQGGQYEQAIAAYQAILKEGLESGNVYYNLANSYLKKNDLGRARLHYERALRLIPRDSDLRANYRYARSRIKNLPTDDSRPWWQKGVSCLDDFLSLNEMLEFLFFILLLAGTFHVLSLYFFWPRRMSVLIFIMVGMLSLFFAGGITSRVILNKDEAIVLTDTEAKFEPREDATTYFNLYEGHEVRSLKLEGLWCKIERPDGKKGWIKNEALEKI